MAQTAHVVLQRKSAPRQVITHRSENDDAGGMLGAFASTADDRVLVEGPQDAVSGAGLFEVCSTLPRGFSNTIQAGSSIRGPCFHVASAGFLWRNGCASQERSRNPVRSSVETAQKRHTRLISVKIIMAMSLGCSPLPLVCLRDGPLPRHGAGLRKWSLLSVTRTMADWPMPCLQSMSTYPGYSESPLSHKISTT